ncbi:uncharacterized protein [Atheta coriaria]|uniref:uncharacterized protein n=1 Tax=Dalotia coriaria TaxID=877792 RepID=UPI0031F45791
MRSDNLNFSHPLFSYSRNERDRLIRVWVSDRGLYVNMAILEQDVFKIPINVNENHWNHFCPSWNAKTGTWSFYYNGKLIQTGLNYKLRDVIIPGQGDIVIGQEYTDFDKGLDDGVEGDVYAFNFVASSTTPPKHLYQQKTNNYRRQMYIPSYSEYVLKPTPPYYQSDTPTVVGYFTTTTREPKGLMDFGQSMLKKLYNLFDMRELRSKLRFPYELFGGTNNNVQTVQIKYGGPVKRAYKHGGHDYMLGNVVESADKTLGMFLVELSYENCVLGRGAPLVDEKVIVSWTKTPVRVFGGAILKTVMPFCRKM